MKKAFAMRQVAALAGCSLATVSLALRDSSQISDRRKRQILKIAAEAGYQANPLLSTLMGRKRLGQQTGLTLRKVALEARVSLTSASLALRGSALISESTKTKVLRAALQLGYRQDLGEKARNVQRHGGRLGTRSSATIGFINSFKNRAFWEKNPAFTRFVDGARNRAEAHGLRMEEFGLMDRGMTAERLTRVLRARGIQGVIIGSAPGASATVPLDWKWFCAVAQGFSIAAPRVGKVACDYTQCIQIALAELNHRGYERIGLYVPSEIDLRCRQLWSGGFLAHQVMARPRKAIPVLGLHAQGPEALKNWFAAWRPEAILSAEGKVVPWLRQMGLNVPRDVAVVHLCVNPGHKNEYAEVRNGAGVDHCLEAAGAIALDLVFEQLITNQYGIPDIPRTILVEGRWVDGDTVGGLRRAASPRPVFKDRLIETDID